MAVLLRDEDFDVLIGKLTSSHQMPGSKKVTVISVTILDEVL